MRTKFTVAGKTIKVDNTEPELPGKDFHVSRRITPQQILRRLDAQKQSLELPWGLNQCLSTWLLFNCLRDQLGLTVDEAKGLFVEMATHWEQAGAYQSLLEGLSQHDLEHTPIKKAVILALGPFVGRCWERGDTSHYRDSTVWLSWKNRAMRLMMQLVVFIRAVDYLSELSGAPIKMYAQDPTFRECDEAFLRSFGIEVLRMPKAEALTDSGTLVYAPNIVYTHMGNTISRCVKHQPAIYMGHGAAEFSPRDYQPTSQEASGISSWIRNHDSYDIARVQSRFEQDAIGPAQVHIRTRNPTAEELQEKCTPSCSFVPGPKCSCCA